MLWGSGLDPEPWLVIARTQRVRAGAGESPLSLVYILLSL